MTITQHLYSVKWLGSYVEIHLLQKTLFFFVFAVFWRICRSRVQIKKQNEEEKGL